MYFQIKEFKRGLDTRQSLLTSEPGTLETLQDMHVNQGGELEKRKAFVPYGLPSQTYGFQEVTDAFRVFGSRDVLGWTGSVTTVIGTTGASNTQVLITSANVGTENPVAGDVVSVTGSSVAAINGIHTISQMIGSVIVLDIPGLTVGVTVEATTLVPYFYPPVLYQRLVHPVAGVSMTGVVSTSYYNSLCTVISTWSNGDTLVFYGTDVEKDFYVGEFNSQADNAYDMAVQLTDALDAGGNYTTTGPTLSDLYLDVTGGTVGVGNQVSSLIYNFGRAVTLPDSNLGGDTTATQFALIMPEGHLNTTEFLELSVPICGVALAFVVNARHLYVNGARPLTMLQY